MAALRIFQALVSHDRGPQHQAYMAAEHETAARVQWEREGFDVHVLWCVGEEPEAPVLTAQEHNARVPPVQPRGPFLTPGAAARWFADWTGEYPITIPTPAPAPVRAHGALRCVVCDRRILGHYTEYPDGPVCPECDDDGMRAEWGMPPVRPVVACAEVA